MASENFVDGQFCVARVNSQALLQCFEKRANLGSLQLEASLLSAKDTGSLAGLRPGCMVVGSEAQHLRLGKAALL